MKIACIAWGSLLWKAGFLPLVSQWHPDGPLLPLEFARVSDVNNELALVLCEGAPLMPTRWAYLDVADIRTARELLRQREKITPERPAWIGSVPSLGLTPPQARITRWLQEKALDACVWTALPPKSAGQNGRKLTADEAVAYLDGLSGEVRAHAKDYIQRIPADITTPYRELIEVRLGWWPHETLERDYRMRA